MIKQIIGTVDGSDIVLKADSAGLWTATVPAKPNGEYVVALWAEDDAVIVYSDAEKSGVRYVVKTIKSSTVAVLKLESETSAALGDGPYYVAWPASAKPSYSGSKVTFSTTLS